MKEKLDKIKAVLCEGCKHSQPAMMRDEKEIRQMAIYLDENNIKCDYKYFKEWIFYENSNLEICIQVYERNKVL